MVGADIYLLYDVWAKVYDFSFYAALVLLVGESAAFVLGGYKCPLSALAVKYGARRGYAFDAFLSEKFSRYSFRFFGGLFAVSLVILFLNLVGLR